MDPEDAIWDALNDDRRRAAPNDHERNDHNANADRNTNHNDFAALPFGGPLLVPQPEEGEDPNELLAAVARMHLADIEALREAGAGEDALLALDLFGDELRRALEMVEDREVAAHVQDDNGARGNADRRQGEEGQDRRDEPAQPRAEGPEPTLASLIRRIPGAWALPLPLGGGAQDQPHEDRPRHDEGALPGGDGAHPQEQQNAPAGGADHHDHDHGHEHDDQVWNPGWLLSAARQWMLGNGTPPTDHGDPDIPPECVVCQDVMAPGELIRAPCGHTYDVHCMNTVFMNAARDEALFPPRCCKTTIPTDLVRGRIPTTTLATFSARAAEFATPKRLYCAAPTCSAFLGARYTGWFFAKAILCPGCGAKTCSRCAHKVDPNERHRCSPAEDENQIAAVAAQEEWARCPDCEAFVELVIGCNHMTCRCGAEFCYVCSRRWKTCGCPWWDEDRLLAVREERHERRRRRRRERREREAREQAAADEDEEDVADDPAQEVADIAPAPEEPQAAAPPPPPEDAPGPDAVVLPPPAPHVEEVPVQPLAAPGPLMQALVGPPPGDGGAVFMRPSLRTRRTVDALPPEENATRDIAHATAPGPEPTPPQEVVAPLPEEVALAVESSTPAEPTIAAPVPEAAAPAMEDIPQELDSPRARPAEEPQAVPFKVSRRKSKTSLRRTHVEPDKSTTDPGVSVIAEELPALNPAAMHAPSSEQSRNEEPIPVPAPVFQEPPPSSVAPEATTATDEVASQPTRRHRSHSHGHRSSHHVSRSGSRATRVYHFVPPEAQEVDNGADAALEVVEADTNVAGPDIPPNNDTDEERLDPAQEAHMRQVLKDILPQPGSSRNRRLSQAPVPPSPSPAPPELPREKPPSASEVFYTPPVHSDDLRAPAASTSAVRVYAAPPIEKRSSSSRSSKSGSSQSTKKASSRARKDSTSRATADPSTPKAPHTSRHAEEFRSSYRGSEPSTSKTNPPTTAPSASSSRPRSSSHRNAKPPVVARIPTHGRASSTASAVDPHASSSSLARPATQPPLASSSSRQTLRRSESLQRETRARRETREHWERMHATASASISQQQVEDEAEPVEEARTVDPPASSPKEGRAEEPTRRGREDVRAHRESKYGKGRTVTYMTFEAAQYGSLPAEWMGDATASASSIDVKGKRRATEPAPRESQTLSPVPNVPSSPLSRSIRYQWDPPPKPVYRLHARLRAPVDPLAYASRLMRKTAGARRTLQHVPPPKDRPPLMLPKERDKLRVYQRPPPVVYAQTTMQHAILPTKGPVPPEAKPVLSRQSSSARIERSSTASAARPSHSLDDHKARTPLQADSQRSAGRASSSHSTPHASSPPIHSPRSTVSPRTDQHVRPPSSHHPRSARTASPRIDDVPLHQIYSRFAPVSTLHPSSPQLSHRFAPVSTLHPPIPPPPPEAAPVYACTSSRQALECALPPEGPPVQARTGRHSHPSRRESDPLDFSTMVSHVPASESLYIHSTEFKRALKKWDKCPHDLWAYGFGPGQCLGCRKLLEDTVYRCESCRAVACADCMHDKF